VLFCVLCLIVVPLLPGTNPFAVKINNNNYDRFRSILQTGSASPSNLQSVTGEYFPVVKWPKREAYHSVPPNAEVRNK
jgi:hypothetical protein